MGLFGELDIQNAQDISYVLPAGSYECIVSNCEVKKTKDGRKTGFNILYTVTQEGRYKGRMISEWQRFPMSDDLDILTDAEKETSKSYIKKRLISLGVPEDRINSTDPGELIGRAVAVTVKVRGPKNPGEDEQNQVTGVKPMSQIAPATGSSGGAFS